APSPRSLDDSVIPPPIPGYSSMALNVIHFKHHGHAQWGVARNGLVTPVPGDFATTGAFIVANTVERLASLDTPTLREDEVQLLPPVTRKQQFLCQGANYRQHMIESGMDPDSKKFNMIFTKWPDCIVAADSDLIKPRSVRFLDYEIELGLVMKRAITGAVAVTDANLHEFIAG